MSVSSQKNVTRKNQKQAVRELKQLRVSTDSKTRATGGCACGCARNCGSCYSGCAARIG